jgi:hypothetical protein
MPRHDEGLGTGSGGSGTLVCGRGIIFSGRERLGPDDLSDKVAFVAKPYLPDTVITVIRQMGTLQVIEAASSNVALWQPS